MQEKQSKLKTLRAKKGVSQSELAKLSGVNLRSIQNYEIERRDLSNANIEQIVNLSNALQIPFYEFLTDKVKESVIININKYHKPEH